MHTNTTFMIKRLFIILCLTTTAAFILNAQSNYKQKNDSVREYYRKRADSIATINRVKFFKELPNIPVDTIGEISIRNMNMEELPDLMRFVELSTVDASGNRLVNPDIRKFIPDNVTKLILEDNDIKRIRFGRNSKIEVLILSMNNLKRIPRSIRRLKHLKTLVISNNRIKRIPAFMRRMDSLTEIEINENRIRFNRFAVKRLKNVEILTIALNNIKKLPPNIDDLENVKKLNLAKNKISELPSSFSQLQKLENLIFYQNSFSHIPLQVTMLKNLSSLDFYYNNISVLPDEIGNMDKMKILFLSYNRIRILPDTLQSLHNLKALYIHDNEIDRIPEWITGFEKLEILDISYNNLLSVPDFSEMPALYEIDIQSNKIDLFPWSLMEKPNLRLLIIKNNPFVLDEEEKEDLTEIFEIKRSEGVIIVD